MRGKQRPSGQPQPSPPPAEQRRPDPPRDAGRRAGPGASPQRGAHPRPLRPGRGGRGKAVAVRAAPGEGRVGKG